MSFKITKKLDLSDLGDGWDGAYLEFNTLSFSEIRELSDLGSDENTTKENFDQIAKMVQDHLVSGKAWNGDTLEDVTPKNVLDLPLDVVVNRAVQLLVGTPDPKS